MLAVPRIALQVREWGGYQTKPTVMGQFLAQDTTFGVDQLLIFADAFDVMSARPSGSYDKLERWFAAATEGAAEGVVFNGECNCFPRTKLCPVMEQAARANRQHRARTAAAEDGPVHADGDSPFPYLNSGLFMARKSTLLKLLRPFVEFYETERGQALHRHGGDQAVFQAFCFDQDPDITRRRGEVRCFVDQASDFLLSMYPSLVGSYESRPGGTGCNVLELGDLAKHPGPSKYANLMDPKHRVRCHWLDRCVENTYTGGQPAFLHMAGRSNPTGNSSRYPSDHRMDPYSAYFYNTVMMPWLNETAQSHGLLGLGKAGIERRLDDPATTRFIWAPHTDEEKRLNVWAPADPDESSFTANCFSFTEPGGPGYGWWEQFSATAWYQKGLAAVREAEHTKCGGRGWLGTRGHRPHDCMLSVLAEPPSSNCSHELFVFADFGDGNCACVPRGEQCHGEARVEAKVGSLYRIVLVTAGDQREFEVQTD